MGRLGTIFTYSIVHSGIGVFKDKTPYVVALVEENQQLRLAYIEGYTQDLQVRIGMEVEFVTADERNNPVYRFI